MKITIAITVEDDHGEMNKGDALHVIECNETDLYHQPKNIGGHDLLSCGISRLIAKDAIDEYYRNNEVK